MAAEVAVALRNAHDFAIEKCCDTLRAMNFYKGGQGCEPRPASWEERRALLEMRHTKTDYPDWKPDGS